MATVYGTNATEAFVTVGGNVDAAKAGGRIRVLSDTYEAAAAADGTVIIMGGKVLPTGAQILPSSFLQADDLGTGATIDVILVAVDDATQTEILAGIDISTAASKIDFSTAANIGVLPVTVSEPSYFALLVDDAAITGTIVAHIEYTID